MGLLVSQYKVPIMVSITYLGLSISYHVSSLNTRWYVIKFLCYIVFPMTPLFRYHPQSYWWTDTLLALFVAHRFGNIIPGIQDNTIIIVITIIIVKI